MKIIAIVPVKGKSDRIENKNTKLLDGTPLFIHTIIKLLKCEFIDDVYLDTECDKIIDIANDLDCKILKRDKCLANNDTDGNTFFINEVKNIDADIYIQHLATSPFIEIDTIRNGVDIVKCGKHDSAFLTKDDKLYKWDGDVCEYDIDNIPNSKNLKTTTIETMGLYIITKESALKYNRRIGGTPYQLKASAIECVDVNYPDDFELANYIQAGKREKERRLLNNIKQHLSSAILSDILDDVGYNGFLGTFNLNIPSAKIFGRAKTLKLRKLKDNESYTGIYECLNSYNTIVSNDVIVVENEAGDFAYFGELNTKLAIRSGAVGAIVSGKSRDNIPVTNMGFPVFCTGYYGKDVRKRATLESINKKIEINSIIIHPGDLIFGDQEGVVVIPNKLEDIVVSKVFKNVETELKISIDIAKGEGISSILSKYKGF